jgi:DNA repair exonuclease SbcCD ATPase subunit
MITFKKIKYKNFLSSGNIFTSIDLNKTNNTLIVGQNGSGKSTILDALCFCLFNKPFRKINKNQLINSINEKDCIAEVEFSINESNYKIIRGIKPNIFEIYVNGVKLNEDSSSVDQQKILEQTILKLNYKSFTQIVILGSASFVPFMQLASSHRREIIEDLLDIKVFSAMLDIIKVKIKDSKDTLKTLELKKENVAEKIIMQQDFIKSIEESGQKDIQEKNNKIVECQNEIIEYNQKVENLLSLVKEKQEETKKYCDASETLRKLGTYKEKISNKKQNSNEDLNFFNKNSVCPTCTQNIEEDFRVNRIKELQEILDTYEKNLHQIEETLEKEEFREKTFSDLQGEITNLQNEISKINIKISNSNKLRNNLEQEIQTITNRIENTNTEHEKLSEYKKNLKDILSELQNIKNNYDYYLQVNYLLKDDGVKSNIIRKYLPLINQQVNKYLELMDFYINFNLDEEFNERIETPIHEKFSYASFSEGEKMRIDLSLLFTWREIAKMKNSVVTNLLIMDEVFDSSLDGMGTDEFMKIIKFIVKDANIFVISHKNELHDKFETVLEFEKIKGFSQIKT